MESGLSQRKYRERTGNVRPLAAGAKKGDRLASSVDPDVNVDYKGVGKGPVHLNLGCF